MLESRLLRVRVLLSDLAAGLSSTVWARGSGMLLCARRERSLNDAVMAGCEIKFFVDFLLHLVFDLLHFVFVNFNFLAKEEVVRE